MNSVNQVKKSQSIALQSQLNSHFLFNTLNHIHLSIANLAGTDNPASKMLVLLSDLLYFSLSNVEYVTSIKAELDHVSTYIELELIKYEHNFDVEWEIDEDLYDYRTLKMVLQPIVENALNHGIRYLGDSRRGKLSIKTYAFGDTLCYEISDNGVGIPAEKLKKLQEDIDDINNIPSKHIGLKNVNQRVRLIFGDEYGITIDSTQDEGTSVLLTLPLISKEETEE